MKIVLVDLETTGLDPTKHEIIEIGAVIGSEEHFSVKIHPLRIKEADPKALEINGYKPEDWADEAFLLPQALKLLSMFVGNDKMMMAYNVSFDRSFLEKAYRDCGLPYPFHYHHLDLMTLVWRQFGQTLSLRNACLALNMEPEPDIHNALMGAMKGWDVYSKLTI